MSTLSSPDWLSASSALFERPPLFMLAHPPAPLHALRGQPIPCPCPRSRSHAPALVHVRAHPPSFVLPSTHALAHPPAPSRALRGQPIACPCPRSRSRVPALVRPPEYPPCRTLLACARSCSITLICAHSLPHRAPSPSFAIARPHSPILVRPRVHLPSFVLARASPRPCSCAPDRTLLHLLSPVSWQHVTVNI
jgi:hypothetical protein